MDSNFTVQSMNISKFHHLPLLPEAEERQGGKKKGPMFDLYVAPKHVTLPTVSRLSPVELEESSVLSNTSQIRSVSKTTPMVRDMASMKSKESDGTSSVPSAHQIDSFSQAFLKKKKDDKMARLIINSSKLPPRNEGSVQKLDCFDRAPLSDRTDYIGPPSPAPVQRKPSILSLNMDSTKVLTPSKGAIKDARNKYPRKESSSIAFSRPTGKMLTPFRVEKNSRAKGKHGPKAQQPPAEDPLSCMSKWSVMNDESFHVEADKSAVGVPYQRVHVGVSPQGSICGDPARIYGQYDNTDAMAEASADAIRGDSFISAEDENAEMVPTSIILPKHLQISNDSESTLPCPGELEASRMLNDMSMITFNNANTGKDTLDMVPSQDYRIHSRLMGWKLTSAPRRKTLLTMLDYMEGQLRDSGTGKENVEEALAECQKMYNKGMLEDKEANQVRVMNGTRYEMHDVVKNRVRLLLFHCTSVLL